MYDKMKKWFAAYIVIAICIIIAVYIKFYT